MKITNSKLASYAMLDEMYRDSYFPKAQVNKVKAILVELCVQIEAQKPKDATGLFKLTHAAVEKINGLQEKFEENDSELETGAREAIAANFDYIVKAYGFTDLDIEDVIAPREW